MNTIDIKEKIYRLKCVAEKIKYKRKKHFYIAVFLALILMVVAFSIIFINQRSDIKRKENILKSFYLEAKNGKGSEDSESYKINLDYKNLENVDSESKDTLLRGDLLSDVQDAERAQDTQDTRETIKVYICGHVKMPDVYGVENGARIVDVLELAGGPTEEACLEIINLASMVIDGQRIYIPSWEEINKSGIVTFLSSDYLDRGYNISYSERKTININFASRKELESLPGIGPVIAQNIIDYRDKYGPFKTKDGLKNVKGIGEKKYEEIKDFISI